MQIFFKKLLKKTIRAFTFLFLYDKEYREHMRVAGVLLLFFQFDFLSRQTQEE